VTYILLQFERTALHWAVIKENIPLVETLIRSGADVNAHDEVSWNVCDEMSWSVSVTSKKHNPM